MSAFDDLARTIQSTMEGIATQEAARRAKNNQAMRGIIKNNMVKVNGRLYPYRIATDMIVKDAAFCIDTLLAWLGSLFCKPSAVLLPLS